MRTDKHTTIINTFLLILLLIILAIILYLLYTFFLADLLNGNNQNPNSANNGDAADDGSGNQNKSNLLNSRLATFSYSYPANWNVEENVDADFTTIRNETGETVITIRVAKKPTNLKDLPLGEYAKVAALNEIQGFKELISINDVTTDYGDRGYQTTWKISFLGSEDYSSNPITYFAHPFDPTKTIQVNLENQKYLNEYNIIIKSFEIKE